MTNIRRKPDVYTRSTVSALEKGVKPCTRPWNAAHAAGHVSRPLRHNGQPYAGINVLTLLVLGHGTSLRAPIWMTFKQAMELGGHVGKGEWTWLFHTRDPYKIFPFNHRADASISTVLGFATITPYRKAAIDLRYAAQLR